MNKNERFEKIYFQGQLNEKEVLDKWFLAFAADVEAKFMEEHVLSKGNYLWHIFSWEAVPCLTGEAACRAFDSLEYDTAIMFENGYSWSQDGTCCCADSTKLSNLKYTKKVSAIDLDATDDVYIVAADFSWVYVHTHEGMCGPYFCKK